MLDNDARIIISAQLVDAKPRGWRLPIDMAQLAATLRRGVSSIHVWGGIPIRPIAAMWEASLWASRPDPRDGCYAPDPFVTESPFLADDWLK